jgi:hypothetical protein
MSVLLVVVAAAAAAACGDSADGGNPMGLPDANGGTQDAASSSDGAPAPGLMIEWVDSPALPGPQNLPTMVNVTSAKFHIKKLEVISDGGTSPATTQDEFDIRWNATMAPQPIFFTSAPPAIYSKIRLSIDKGSSNAPSVEIVGTVTINATTEMFRISSIEKIDLEVEGYLVNLTLGDSEGMPIIVGLDALLADVNWMSLPVESNARTLDDRSATMAEMDLLFDHLEDTFTGPLE